MSKNTSISLGEYFETFIENSIDEGRYKNASEMIRAGLRLLADEETKILLLQKEINEGIKSGVAGKFNPAKHLGILKAAKK